MDYVPSNSQLISFHMEEFKEEQGNNTCSPFKKKDFDTRSTYGLTSRASSHSVALSPDNWEFPCYGL